MRAVLLALLLLLSSAALAVSPGEILDDPALEARARAISSELRCLVCQNQSIDDSDADLAGELRVIVRERLVAGDTDDGVRQYVVDRYGEFVLLRPILAWHTIVLWIAAPAILLIGLGTIVVLAVRRRRDSQPEAVGGLSEDEQRALDELGETRG